MITVLPVFREEGWHSMDLCAEMLLKHSPVGMEFEESLPKYRKVLGWLPGKKARNFDRWYNRWKVYPHYVEGLWSKSGFFHLVDHSYAHLIHHLPEGRAGVYCHDLDAFRSILEPKTEPRPAWFQKMMQRVFDGLKKAKVIFCSTEITRNRLLQLGFWQSKTIHVVAYGIAGEFVPEGSKEPGNYLLHVGSCIPRKRIDLLLDIYAKIHSDYPEVQLIQAGGTFSEAQLHQIKHLGIGKAIQQRRGLSREGLARLYRGAKCLLVTSEAEGFGLPVIEALSCGCPVVASDIPSLREAGGEDAQYCPILETGVWVKTIAENLDCGLFEIRNDRRANISERYSWQLHAKTISEVYSSFTQYK